MGLVVYNVLIRLFNLVIILYSRFNDKARLLVSGRRRAFQEIRECINKADQRLWFHCASLGEYEQALPLLEEVKTTFPNYTILVSFFSPSGYEYRKNSPVHDCVFYLPADTASNARELVDLIDPAAVFFIKYEFWYHYLNTCKKNGIPVFSISTILRPEQVFFRSYGAFYRKMLRMFDYFFVQNQETLSLLNSIGIQNAEISGDTRFDRVQAILQRKDKFPLIEAFKADSRMMVLGSTWEKDIALWANYINQNDQLKYIIAPHDITEQNIETIRSAIRLVVERYSRYAPGSEKTQVLIIDNIGMLSALYYYADITYVGGAFGEGVHNILEPATFGKPVIIGKSLSNKKYQEVVDLLESGGAFAVDHRDEVDRIMGDLLNNETLYSQACQASRSYIDSNVGATRVIMDHLRKALQ